MTIDEHLAVMFRDPEFRDEYTTMEANYKMVTDLIRLNQFGQVSPQSQFYAAPPQSQAYTQPALPYQPYTQFPPSQFNTQSPPPPFMN